MAGAAGLITWDVSVDSTIAGAPARGRRAERGDLQVEPPGGADAEPASLRSSKAEVSLRVTLAERLLCDSRGTGHAPPAWPGDQHDAGLGLGSVIKR
jgi:hypothetical protein